METKDTYMKLSWLTVTENSMDKQHVCVVKHMKNIGGIDQEIIFPSVKEGKCLLLSELAEKRPHRGHKMAYQNQICMNKNTSRRKRINKTTIVTLFSSIQ